MVFNIIDKKRRGSNDDRYWRQREDKICVGYLKISQEKWDKIFKKGRKKNEGKSKERGSE